MTASPGNGSCSSIRGSNFETAERSNREVTSAEAYRSAYQQFGVRRVLPGGSVIGAGIDAACITCCCQHATVGRIHGYFQNLLPGQSAGDVIPRLTIIRTAHRALLGSHPQAAIGGNGCAVDHGDEVRHRDLFPLLALVD